MRPQAAPRAMWRRANSAMSSAAARLFTWKQCSWVSAVTGVSRRPKPSVAWGRNVSPNQASALLIRISTGPSAASARSNSSGTADGSGQIRCPRGCPTTCSLDRLRDRLASLRTGYGVAREASGLHTGIIGPQAQVGKKDGHTLVGECACRGGPDSLVGAGHDGHPSLDAWVDHSSASFLAWCQPRRRRSCSSSSARACSAAARRSSTSCSRCSSCRARRRTSRDGSICVPSRSRTPTKGCVA